MNEPGGYGVEDLRPDSRAACSTSTTEADIVLFACASGDHNAVHTDEEFARTTCQPKGPRP